jgi:F-type H+-transporting ATPase subunit gamma
MSDLKTLRNRIKGVKNIQKITQAMKVVAASKLRKARIAAEESRLFSDATRSSFFNSIKSIEASDDINLDFLSNTESSKTLLIVVASDRGLCGGLNNNLVKYSIAKAKSINENGGDCKLFLIGKKVSDPIKTRAPELILSQNEGFSSRKIDVEKVVEFKNQILALVNQENFGSVRLIYTGFESAISQTIIDKLFIGSKNNLLSEFDNSGEKIDSKTNFEYEPNKEEVILALFDYYMLSSLNQSFYESFASEQGARMSAMDNAVKNCKELTNKLTLIYNRTRQAKITTELVEIISAVESLK